MMEAKIREAIRTLLKTRGLDDVLDVWGAYNEDEVLECLSGRLWEGDFNWSDVMAVGRILGETLRQFNPRVEFDVIPDLDEEFSPYASFYFIVVDGERIIAPADRPHLYWRVVLSDFADFKRKVDEILNVM